MELGQRRCCTARMVPRETYRGCTVSPWPVVVSPAVVGKVLAQVVLEQVEVLVLAPTSREGKRSSSARFPYGLAPAAVASLCWQRTTHVAVPVSQGGRDAVIVWA